MKLLNVGLWIIMLGLFGLQMYVFAEVFGNWKWGEVTHPPHSLVSVVLLLAVLGVVYLTRRARNPKGPRYMHDCDRCVFMEHWNGYDLYYCYAPPSNVTMVARSSDDGPDYASAPLLLCRGSSHPELRRAYDLYVAL